MNEVLNYVKSLGVGCRHPHDEFLREGNEICEPNKPFGISDFGEEEFYHKPYLPFSCHIPGCTGSFETVIQYEAHYNSCHSFTCKECRKNFPNNHLLDIHISEAHDSFFQQLACKKPMYCCFIEECKEVFMTSEERQSHCISVHKLPSDFRFGLSKKKSNRRVSKKNTECSESDETKTSSHSKGKNVGEKKKKNTTFKGFTFGQAQSKRKPVFHNFSKDLMNSLPKE
ncbi:hypothetical protein RUM44_004518 [Polyplax serrata]|uniref:C2H2-type domain-containing protein n=1 Tax=Polyplax serrata TaxID=468196 RepID=A0ABR1B316_POLSC